MSLLTHAEVNRHLYTLRQEEYQSPAFRWRATIAGESRRQISGESAGRRSGTAAKLGLG